MRRQPSLRSQLNQIRMWVRQGRTDAWIAHKLDVSVDDLARFKREHDLEGDGDQGRARPADPLSVPAPEPRSEDFDEAGDEEDEEEEPRPERERPRRRRRSRSRRPAVRAEEEEEQEEEEEEVADEDDEAAYLPAAAGTGGRPDEEEDGAPRRRRRRGRRGGRRHRGRGKAYEATFDHGGEGYGLWLDPAVAENPVYSEHWAGHRAVTVTVDEEAITIRRVPPPDDGAAGDSDTEPGAE